MENKIKNSNNNKLTVDNMSIVGHLEELRKRIFYLLIALVCGTIVSFIFIKEIILFLKAPIAGLNIKLYYFKPYEKLTTYFKIALFSGLIVSVPFTLYQISRFILPALYNKERRFYFFYASSHPNFVF